MQELYIYFLKGDTFYINILDLYHFIIIMWRSMYVVLLFCSIAFFPVASNVINYATIACYDLDFLVYT